MTGATCSAGTCASGTFVGMVNVGNLYMSTDPFSEHNTRCAAAYAGSRQCTRADVDRTMQYSTICAAGTAHIIVNDMGRFQSGYGWYYMCRGCSSGQWDTICNGQLVPCCR